MAQVLQLAFVSLILKWRGHPTGFLFEPLQLNRLFHLQLKYSIFKKTHGSIQRACPDNANRVFQASVKGHPSLKRAEPFRSEESGDIFL